VLKDLGIIVRSMALMRGQCFAEKNLVHTTRAKFFCQNFNTSA